MRFEDLANRYRGERARDYDLERASSATWRRERDAVENFLAEIPRGSRVLDVPVGTGRFLELYSKYGLKLTGVDVSPDMLAQSSAKAKALGLDIELCQADIRSIPQPDDSFDVAVCLRFLNWVDFEGVRAALSELARLSPLLIAGIRCYYPAGTNLDGYSSWQRLRGLKRRLKRRVLGSTSSIYDQQRIEALFGECGLSIVKHASADPRYDRSDMLIYLLRRGPRT